MKQKSSRSALFLMELIFSILFFALASAVCVQLFVKAHLLSVGTQELNHALTSAQSAAGNTEQAIDTLRALVSDYPELAEPHNNLAVIYASRGDYSLARTELETAISLNPSYATAFENPCTCIK